MNQVSKATQLKYPWGEQTPAPASIQEVAKGIYWIKMPLPFALDHINLWLMEDELNGQAGWTVVDCGVAKEPVKELWQQLFASVLDGKPILRVVVTHMHPDHVGLAGWLCKCWQAPLWMSMTDFFVATTWSQDKAGAGTGGDSAVRHFASHGLLDADSQEKIRQRATYYPSLVEPMPKSFNRLLDGQTLKIGANNWHLISGYGHAPEHISLYSDQLNVLIVGDMVLPKISTNISVFDYDPNGNPLPLYLDSLLKYLSLPANTLVLPSHGRPFIGLHERIKQQQEHHAERLDEILQYCKKPSTAADIVPKMFKRKLDLHQLTFAMGEALAHLHAAYYEGKLNKAVDAQGVIRFQTLP